MKRIFVTDNLTPERAKLLRKLREDQSGRIRKAYSVEGKLKVSAIVEGRERYFTIDSLADVVKLGWPEEEIKALGIFEPTELSHNFGRD